jgi:hypothetical protein
MEVRNPDFLDAAHHTVHFQHIAHLNGAFKQP